MTESTLYIIYIVGAMALSALCGFLAIPIIIKYCKEKGLYDKPNGRKIHSNNIPRLGGLSFLPSMLLASVTFLFIYRHNSGMGSQVVLSSWSLVFLASLLIIYGVGIIDDIAGLGARTKFAAQIVAAALLPLSGLYINNLYGFLGINEFGAIPGFALTVFVIVFACNAINLIDGIDGLSTSLSLLAFAGFLVCFYHEHIYTYCLMIAAMIGVLLAFLYFNVWGKAERNNKIFMGDSGSLTLGFILGFLFVKFTMDNPSVRTFSLNSMVLAYTLLIVPVFDVVRVSLVRLSHKTYIFLADKNHIHHKLLRAGLTQHQTLMAIVALAAAFIVLNLLLSQWFSFSLIVCIDIAAWIIFHALLNRKIRQKGEPVFLPAEPAEPTER